MHKNSLEFTKDSHLTRNGDCIVGINATFDKDEIVSFIKNKEKITIDFFLRDKLLDTLECTPNPNFSDEHEIVIRIGTFCSDRTFGINSTKSSYALNRDMVSLLKSENTKIKVRLK
jgi:hypothetical protein